MNEVTKAVITQATGYFQTFYLWHLDEVDEWETIIGSQLLSLIRTVQWQLLAQVRLSLCVISAKSCWMQRIMPALCRRVCFEVVAGGFIHKVSLFAVNDG